MNPGRNTTGSFGNYAFRNKKLTIGLDDLFQPKIYDSIH